jgi:hypothetical protein
MYAVTIEVRCRLQKDDPEWNNIARISIEAGYPGRSGKTIWKHIGWLHDPTTPLGKSFIHAIWNPQLTEQVIIFEFMPVYLTNAEKPEHTYRIRKTITTTDGKQKQINSRLLRGNYQDEYFLITPLFPETKPNPPGKT